MDTITLRLLTCLRCTAQWIPKVETPATCPRCKSPYWDKPRRNSK